MKRIDINEIMVGIFESGRSFEELTEVEQMVLALSLLPLQQEAKCSLWRILPE